jgi:multiple sugar transport system permease protein
MNVNAKARMQLRILRILVYSIIILLCFLCLFFFYLMIINSTRTHGQLQQGFTMIPGSNFINNLKNAWTKSDINIPVGMKNSFFVSAMTSLLTSYVSALTAYGTYVYRFKFRKYVHVFILAVMMIPTQVNAVGFVQLAMKYNLTNNLWMLIIPAIASPAVYFYMYQYLKATLPLEMVEASRIDGAGEFYTFNKIVLPIMQPALAVQIIFSFIASWNNYFTPSLLLSKADKKTVPIMIAQLRSADYSKFDMGQVYMLMLLAIIPVLLIYIFLSRFIIKNVTSGSVKG